MEMKKTCHFRHFCHREESMDDRQGRFMRTAAGNGVRGRYGASRSSAWRSRHCSVSAQQFTKEIAAHLQVTPEQMQKRSENSRYYVF